MKQKPAISQVALVSLLLLLVGLFIATIILASVPPVDRDALTHHLFVPKLWLQYGGIYEIPEIPFSYYPMNLDLLYTIALYFGNDIVPKYIHYCFALLTALLLYFHLKKRLGIHYGLFGALFFLCVPIIVKLSITVYVDLGLVFFTTASLLLLLHWAEKGFTLHLLLFSGVSCGLAAGTKYNGLIAIVVLTLFVPILYQRSAPKNKQHNGKALLWGFVFAVATFTSFSPWLVRNYVWTGNPIYPLHNGLIQKLSAQDNSQQETAPVDITDTLQQVTSQGSSAFISRKILYNESWWQALLLPIRFFYEGQDDNPQFFDGKLSPFLLLLPCLAFVFKPTDTRQRKEQNFLLSFTLLYFFFTFFQESMRIRYIVPIVPPLVILSMNGLHGTINKIHQRIQPAGLQKIAAFIAGICIPGLMLWYNAQYIVGQFSTVNPMPYVLGKMSRDAYITTFRPEYPAIQWLNEHTTSSSRVLCLFLGNRGYYMDFFPLFLNPYSQVFPEISGDTHYVLLRNDMYQGWLDSVKKEGAIFHPSFDYHNPLYSASNHSIYTVSSSNP